MLVRKYHYRFLAMRSWKKLARIANISEGRPTVLRQWAKYGPKYKQTVLSLETSTRKKIILKRVFAPQDEAHFYDIWSAQNLASNVMQSVPNCHVPEVLAIDGASQSVLIEHIEGNALQNELKGYANQTELFERVGNWLHHYHTQTTQETRIFQPKFMACHLGNLAQEARAGKNTVVEADRFASECIKLAGGSFKFEDELSTIAARHGDFNLYNIIVSDDQISVIDYSPTQYLPVGYDISRFMIHYMLLFGDLEALGPGQIVSPEIEEAFFSTYQVCGPDDPSYRFLSRVKVMQEWNVLSRHWVTKPKRSRIRLARLKKLVDQFTDND